MITDQEKTISVAASSDWHIRRSKNRPRYLQTPQYRELIQEMSLHHDLIAICGDIIDSPKDRKSTKLDAQEAATVFSTVTPRVPVVAVLGNHDHNGGNPELVKQILTEEGGVTMLEGQTYTIGDLGVAGVKGFMGGFDSQQFEPYGEKIVWDFCNESQRENLVLKESLSSLQTPKKLVVTHYAPIRATFSEMLPELHFTMGNSGLEDVIDSDDKVVTALHGHAHYGRPIGVTRGGVVVYNVAIKVLQQNYGSGRYWEIPKLYRSIKV